jgi:hypothetical protein
LAFNLHCLRWLEMRYEKQGARCEVRGARCENNKQRYKKIQLPYK